MKVFDRFAKKLAGKASVAVKTEVKKTAIDLLPAALSTLGAIAGILIFKKSVDEAPVMPRKPSVSNTSVTTNNYFFQSLSEDAIQRIIDGK